MKRNALVLALTLGASVLSGAVMAADAPTHPGTGTVTFSGEINNSPCSISASTQNQTVPMGSVSAHVLEKGGHGRQNPFSIELQDCDLTAAAGKSVSVTFMGGEAANSGLFAMPTDLGGVGLALTDASGTAIKPNSASTGVKLIAADQTLRFNAALQGLNDASNPVTPNKFSTILDFQMNYQ